MRLTDVPGQPRIPLLALPDAMTIVALERQNLHEKVVRLRALREAAEAKEVLTTTNVSASKA
jgi:hypothetical protein